MKKTFIAVRDVDEEIFKSFKEASIRERMNLGIALTLAMKTWLKERLENKKEAGISGIKPEIVGDKKVAWSKEIDETLYGEK